MNESKKSHEENPTGVDAEAASPPPGTGDPARRPRSKAADEWSARAIQGSNRAATDEDYRKELAKRIR